jgi:aldose 1-epimerase
LTPFGTLKDGRNVDTITLAAHGMRVTVLTYGAILQDVRLDGVDHSLTVGSDDIADYEGGMAFHGAIVGPVANRITNAVIKVDGDTHTLDANLGGGHMLHGGSAETHTKIWTVVDHTAEAVTLACTLPDGEGGFPANRHVQATFEITQGPVLRLTLTTTTDAPSVANLTNHSYWNLDGTDHMQGHIVTVDAAQYLPADAQTFPTGEVADVASTAFDFQTPTQFVAGSPPLDTTFCVARARRELAPCMILRGASGLVMTVATTEAGVHLYDGRPAYDGVAIECQGWPDAPRHSHFPSICVVPDAPVIQVTEWRFNR